MSFLLGIHERSTHKKRTATRTAEGRTIAAHKLYLIDGLSGVQRADDSAGV